jgi:uncharacterized protein (DUF952 family)
MGLYHIAIAGQWQAAQATGLYVADSLATEGFIHCSTEAQILAVANAFFRGQSGLLLLEIEGDRLQSPLKMEWVDTGDLFGVEMPREFPHVYGPINVDAVVGVSAFEPGADGVFQLAIRN